MTLQRHFRLLQLRFRASILEDQANDAHELILSTTRHYDMLIAEHRRVTHRIDALTPAAEIIGKVSA